ncbi:hypothetical protein Pcinc_019994 [Petrolisthes cinctipes]|uniref:Uncharacterized protein n=1 Tax=Petrolisthes cinctipes TaxID=88211 RepID=A0AAE1FJ32_PETCI|nr:hypothetical protein Pcinc_019994 [Petrolisthes cinctipes]
MAMKCKVRKEATQTKRSHMNQTFQAANSKTCSEATKLVNATNVPLGVEKVMMAKMLNCILNAHMLNMANPDSTQGQKNTPDTIPEGPGPNTTSNPRKRRKMIRDRNTRSETEEENKMDTDNDQPILIPKLKGSQLDLHIITSETYGWPKEGMQRDKLIDSLQRRKYKWMYDNPKYDEAEVYRKLCEFEIDLKDCWVTLKEDRFKSIVPGFQTQSSKVQTGNRDLRLRVDTE